MKLYVKGYSSYKGDMANFDVKQELKKKYQLDTRRQDTFIHYAVYGAQLLKEHIKVDPSDELYITSGVGNIDILQKTKQYVEKEGQFIKPFDFINILGNTTSYYVATSLGLKGKNSFQISDNFTFINTLMSIYASLCISGKDAILGSIDFVSTPDEVLKRVLELEKDSQVTSGVNYQKFSLTKENAIAAIELDPKTYSFDEIKSFIEKSEMNVMVSPRAQNFEQTGNVEYFETIGSWFVNKALENQEELIYIDCYDKYYKMIKVLQV